VRTEIESRAGYSVAEDLLRTLVDWEILRPASE
jgi:hypothetical protein